MDCSPCILFCTGLQCPLRLSCAREGSEQDSLTEFARAPVFVCWPHSQRPFLSVLSQFSILCVGVGVNDFNLPRVSLGEKEGAYVVES